MSATGSLILSVDVEDWPQSTWDRSLPITRRAVENTERLLALLAEAGVTVTMFVLGKLAETHPGVVKAIAAAGHEVASHGYGHVEIFTQTPEVFREDVRRSRRLLEDLTGSGIVGFRAPDFSITGASLWALDVLAEEGFRYDSSIFPIRHARYGIVGWPDTPVTVRLPSGRSIVELPIATRTVGGRRLPVAGGGYHRLLPGVAIRMLVRSALASGNPFMAYCHPYEFDPREFAEIDVRVPLKVRLHQGLGRSGFRSKFTGLLAAFPVAHARSVALDRSWPDYAHS